MNNLLPFTYTIRTCLKRIDGIQYFGQKDLSSCSDHENGLLEKLVSGKVGQNGDVNTFVDQVILAVSQLLEAEKIPEQIEETTIKKSEVEHKMSIYAEKGVAAKLRKQTGYTTDNTKLEAIRNRVDGVLQSYQQVYDSP